MDPVPFFLINTLATGLIACLGRLDWWRTPLWLAVGLIFGAVVAYGDGYVVYNMHYSMQGPATIFTVVIAGVLGLILMKIRPSILGA